jgi:error-prone DNA polymerase
MKIAMDAAKFTAAEADGLRRAMATFRRNGTIGQYRDKMIERMTARGYTREFAERCFHQIEGFGDYGFPESHAASFAKIAYASCWMKCHHPDVFCAALLNAQPMGFYAPAQIVRDAREHGVEARPVCINDSDWDTRMLPDRCESRPRHAGFCGIDADWETLHPLRLGMRIVQGLAQADAEAIIEARLADGPFTSVEEAWRRSKVKPAALERLARADAFQAFGLNRRQALWAVKALGEKPLPLLAASDARAGSVRPEVTEQPVALVPLTEGREVVEDYRATQLSLRAHPVAFLRDRLAERRITRCGDLTGLKDGDMVEVAGLILVRQRPGSAKGVVFVTLEDETGIANAVLWPDRFQANRRTVMSATMLAIRGRMQREGLVIHVVAERITDLTDWLRHVGQLELPRLTMPGDGATHGGEIDPRDRLTLPRQRPADSWPPRRSLKAPDLIPVRSRDFH